jgi:glycosidase
MTEVSQDFVFGTLATDELRLARIIADAAGVLHAHDLEPIDPDPGVPIRVGVTLGRRIDADRVTCYYTTDGQDPAGGHGVANVGTAVELERIAVDWDTLSWSYRERWAGSLPGQADGTLIRYRIEAWSDRSPAGWWASEVAGLVRGPRPADVSDEDAATVAWLGDVWPVRRTGAYAVHVDRDRVPAWLRDAVIYQVFVDRFAPPDGRPFATPATPSGFYGGSIRGVLQRLDHIAQLGADCIWLSPIFPSPSHHGYDATDLRSVEPRLGTEDDLRALIAAAHDRGIRVILDFAVNHVSSAHLAFQAALADRSAPTADWFTFTNWPDEYLTFFGVRDHPQIDSDDPGARAHMIDAARHWLDLGVDGFRCDYANGPSHAFWSEFRAAIRETAPEGAMLGEVVETPAVQRTYRGRMDGCLDFILLQLIRGAFAFGTLSPSELDASLRRHLAYIPDDFVLPSFLDNHDMNRFLWVVGGDVRRLRLAALFQFTLPSPPIVYYGTEVGLSQERDVRSADGRGHPEESRLPMPWNGDQDRALYDTYQGLVTLRRSAPGLWRGERTTVLTDDATGSYAVRCQDGDRAATIVLNNGPEARRIAVGADGLRLAFATDLAVVLRSDGLDLPPFGGAVLMTAD